MSTLLEPMNDTPPEATPAAAIPTAEPDQAPVATPEETTTTSDGSKFVPLAALHAEREEKRALKAQLEAATARSSDFEQLQRQFQELSARMPQPKEEPVAPVPLMDDGEADALARTLQLFDATGAPDRDAARRVGGLVSTLATKQAKEAVAPIVALSAAERAHQFRERSKAVVDPDGRVIDPKLIDQMYAVVPPEIIAANPQVPAILAYAAAGYERIHGKKAPVTPASAPIVSERAGGRMEQTHGISDFELGHLQRSGVKTEDYVKSLKNYKPGMPLVLE